MAMFGLPPESVWSPTRIGLPTCFSAVSHAAIREGKIKWDSHRLCPLKPPLICNIKATFFKHGAWAVHLYFLEVELTPKHMTTVHRTSGCLLSFVGKHGHKRSLWWYLPLPHIMQVPFYEKRNGCIWKKLCRCKGSTNFKQAKEKSTLKDSQLEQRKRKL